MAYSYLFDPVAAEEYEDAFKWYEKRSILAADNFVIRVQEAISAICADPYRFRNAYKDFHELAVKKYPYHVIYNIDKDEKVIVIASIFHHKRHPRKKYEK
ncbi:MAG TPA: type II toxin-antitoxin system RelE/ParE family toxin [Puia sp.]|jgi:plasmid stabilization system protein ParE|nr:type II toxin-antitoxin system RelE/ParE family toxin [Puia sp.]